MSENGPNGFPMPKNLGIDTKIMFLACAELKLEVWPSYLIWSGHKWPFGHSGQSEVSENDPNEFPMLKNLGIDTKIKSEPKLHFWPSRLAEMTKNGHLATHVNLRCLKMVPMNFSCPKTWG